MRRTLKSLFALLLVSISFTQNSFAKTVTAINSGTWTSGSTWSATLASGDLLEIPNGITVQVTSNMDLKSYTFTIDVAGVLDFVGGGAKLNLGALSQINVTATGEIFGNSNASQVIAIGSNNVYNSKNLNVITGPSYATSATPGFLAQPVTLPVKFESFSVAVQGSSVSVQWSADENASTNFYTVERSTDASNWNTVETVNATHHSNEASDYSYTDNTIQATVVYYRIRQTDISGSVTYSQTKEITESTVSKINVYSNGGKIFLQFATPLTARVSVRIVSLSGQVLMQQDIAHANGLCTINASNLSTGNYIVSLSDGSSFMQSVKLFL